ncbi:MAG: DUF3391 domain-containing protein, partial [Treponema sp.]|nr:DUF3391 domain-containing protein [Treponema sp.]
MKKIDVKTLTPGMIFSSPVYIEGNNLLVPAGIAIRKKDIDRLVSWGYSTVSTDGSPVSPNPQQNTGKNSAKTDEKADNPVPGLSGGTVNKVSGNVLSLTAVQENKGAYRSYVNLIERLDGIFANIGSGISVEPRTVDNLAGELLQAVREDRDHIIGFILGGEVLGHVL